MDYKIKTTNLRIIETQYRISIITQILSVIVSNRRQKQKTFHVYGFSQISNQ